MTTNQMTNQGACSPGWYYDPLHRQPIYLFWRDTHWWARFVWQEMPPGAADTQDTAVSTQDTPLTSDMYHRLIHLTDRGGDDYINRGGCAIRDVQGIRAQVQVKLASDGRGVWIQAPALDTSRQPESGCEMVWLADDEIPTIIRALQARRRAVLDPDSTVDSVRDEE